MTDNPNFQPADYRVRLFLSADLSGSTAFKNSRAGTERGTEGVPVWVSAFRDFYTDFPDLYRTSFHGLRPERLSSARCPTLWKAVGDELVFCGRVYSKSEAALCIDAFIEVLHSYRRTLQGKGYDLDLKGAAWAAAFPSPNLTVRLKPDPTDDLLLSSEALEAAADAMPFQHDFLGKAIDTGFRVAGTSRRARFVLSVQLARLLLMISDRGGASRRVYLDRPTLMKGVNEGAPYPCLFLDTMEDYKFKEVRELEEEIFGTRKVDHREIIHYLDKYGSAVGTEWLVLPDEPGGQVEELPQSYRGLRDHLKTHLEKEERRLALQEESSSEQPQDTEEVSRELDDPIDLRPADEPD